MTAASNEFPPPRTDLAPIALGLTPQRHVVLAELESLDGDGSWRPSAAIDERIRVAAVSGTADILLCLATLPGRPALPPIFAFWRSFGERYLTELCHVPATQDDARGFLLQPLAAPLDDLAHMAEAAPPMRGGEYLRTETLAELWSGLDGRVRGEIAAEPGGLTQWLNRRASTGVAWHRIGRVCFHLAENKRDPDHPFAFLATYAPKLLDGGRVQYQPLGRALEEFAGAKNRKLLINLLTPVQRAAEGCAWVRELVDSGSVFHALAWTPAEAHRFLRDIPQLEESGLLVRVPDWWARQASHASRVRVGVSIGQAKPTGFGVDAMLDFRMELALDGQELTPEECERILGGADGLVLLKGRWVEVDREKLARALEQWKQVQSHGGADGVSFLQGMRLLAGAPVDAEGAALFDQESATWSDVRAGAWLEESLRAIRQPDTAAVAMPPAGLRATLRPYQEAGVKWLWMLARLGLGACLADDMGLGKTIQVLALLLALKHDRSSRTPQPGPPARPALLVLPASLVANWRAEIERFAPTLRFRCVHPSQMKPAELGAAGEDPAAFLADVDVVLTTYSMLTRMEWLTSVDWSVAVLDEAQAIKNPAARQTRSVKKLKAGVRIALTGTPVENRLTDLWSIFDYVCPGLLGSVKAFGAFVKRLEERSTDQYGPLRRLVAPYILRRLKTDKSIITDLPDKTEVHAFCTLSKKQAALYEQSVRDLAATLQEATAEIARRGAILAFILRFKQICNHPDQWLGGGAYAPEESGKFQRLRAIAEEIASRQEKALVFTQFREITAPLAGFLGEVFGRPGVVLHGGTLVAKRKQLVDEFQREGGAPGAPSPPFMVLSLRAGGTGLNLTAATHVIHFDRWWNPAVENQATDRAFRIGQRHKVMVHKFVCQGTIEEKIDALTRDKAALAGEILEEGVPTLVTEMSDKEILDLVRLDIRKAMEE